MLVFIVVNITLYVLNSSENPKRQKCLFSDTWVIR